ncbi:MAG: hypothetical protein GIKADHBN_01070 [Phycisphaerales bacterium]|nr:hypothetical protein [Phycisphaerales bacterium]MCK6476515.1 hypothetical protein [Phycisphaerales bacterium]
MKLARLMACVAAATVGVMAEIEGRAAGQQPETPTPHLLHPAPQPRINFKFPGGTLTDFVEALKAASAPHPCNVMVSGQGEPPRIPAFEFQDVAVSTAAAAAARSDSRHIAMAVVQEDEGAPVYVFEYRTDDGGGRGQQTEVLSLRSLLDAEPGDPDGVAVTMTADTVLSALQHATGVADSNTSNPALIKFHEESSLLFVRGTPVQLETVRSAYKLLQTDVARRRDRFDGTGLRRMQADLAKLEVEIKFLTDQLETRSARVEQVRQLVQSGAAPVSEATNAESEVAELRKRLDQLMIERQRMQVELSIEQSVRGQPRNRPAGDGPASKSPAGTR